MGSFVEVRSAKTEAALQYARLGLHVLPVWWMTDSGACGCGKPDCRNAGKHPISKIVKNGHLDATTDTELVAAWWTAYPHANIGLSLAPSHLAVIDIDPRNGGDATLEQLEANHGILESSWHQRTGSGGDHFFFQCDPELQFPGKFGAGIDGKHHGYVLLEPSRTYSDYEFLDEGGPLSEVVPSVLPDWVKALCTLPVSAKDYDAKEKGSVAPVIPSDAIGFDWMGEDGRAEFFDALSKIPNVERDDWLKVGMVLHMLDPRPNALAWDIWCHWSQQGDGGGKFDPKDQARVWKSFSNSKETSLHRESIFYWAIEAGWKPVSYTCSAVEVDKKTSEVLGKILQGPKLTVIEPTGKPGRCPVPLIEETAAWISQRGGVFYPDASLVSVLSLASSLASRVYLGTDGSPAHIYFGLSSQSINEIRYALTGLEEILIESGLRRMMRVSRFGSASSVYKCLLNSPSSVYLTSELETIIRFARRQPSGASEIVLNLLADIYCRRDLQIDALDEIGIKNSMSDNQPVIRNPSMTMLALMSSDSWELLGKASEIGRGATELLLAVQCNSDDCRESQRSVAGDVPEWLIEHARKVRRMPAKGATELDADLTAIHACHAELRPDLIPVTFEVKPESFDAVINSLSDNRMLRPILHGARVSMRRLAVALAAWADPDRPVVTEAIMAWCCEFVAYHTSHTIERLDVMGSDDGKVDVGQKVLAKLLEVGADGMTQRDLVKYCRAFKSLTKEKQAELLGKMEDDGDIAIGEPVGRQRGKRIVASRFVKKTALTAELPTGADK